VKVKQDRLLEVGVVRKGAARDEPDRRLRLRLLRAAQEAQQRRGARAKRHDGSESLVVVRADEGRGPCRARAIESE
jgi:hypothetical protein